MSAHVASDIHVLTFALRGGGDEQFDCSSLNVASMFVLGPYFGNLTRNRWRRRRYAFSGFGDFGGPG